MPISTATGLSSILRLLRNQVSAADAELEFFEYSPSAGYQSVGVIATEWFPYRDTTREGRSVFKMQSRTFLFIIVADSEELQTVFKGRPTHALVEDLYYKLTELPERPIAANDMLKYWLVRCEPTGETKPGA